MKNIAFVTTFCPHHRQKTFELFASYYDTLFYFFSAGDEWYWQQEHGVKTGNFRYEYLPGWRIGKTRFRDIIYFLLFRTEGKS